jgi:hypothetical protein
LNLVLEEVNLNLDQGNKGVWLSPDEIPKKTQKGHKAFESYRVSIRVGMDISKFDVEKENSSPNFSSKGDFKASFYKEKFVLGTSILGDDLEVDRANRYSLIPRKRKKKAGIRVM